MNLLARFETKTALSFPPLLGEAEYPVLSPAQQRAFDKLEVAVRVTSVVELLGANGSGRSTILRAFARRYGGRLVSLAELVAAAQLNDGRIAVSGSVEYVEHLVADHDLIVLHNMVIDFLKAGDAAGGQHPPRQAIDGALIKNLCDTVVRLGKRLIIGGNDYSLQTQTAIVEIEGFAAEDYAAIVASILGAERAADIDFKLVHRYASLLNGHELQMACQVIADREAPTTEEFVDALETYVLASNIRVSEVEALSFDSLPGAEEIISKLETQVVLPLEHRQLAHQLGIKPKRGVLLYGPPGTGKTSIGRALAHRMKGKFFLIDGSIVTEPPKQFFDKLQLVIREAKESAPSVLFIDDADVLFNIVHISGLARYLLTLLDGLESESASHVCVMMTAMDVRKVPEALLRSGRVELWLETKAPVGADRGRVLKRWLGENLPAHELVDYAELSDMTEGFTPADLRRITADAKCLFAADQVRGRSLTTANEYLQRAVGNLIIARTKMADALGDERLRVGGAKKKEKYGTGVGGMAEMAVSCKTSGWN